MIFKGIDDQTVEFKILNYQYPKLAIREEYDSNWLVIYLNIKSKLGNWQVRHSSLLTWEIEYIINWLTNISNNQPGINNLLEFIEPNLAFELIENKIDAKRVRIKFDLESKPNPEDDKVVHYYVDCSFSTSTLLQTTADLKSELKNYPKR